MVGISEEEPASLEGRRYMSSFRTYVPLVKVLMRRRVRVRCRTKRQSFKTYEIRKMENTTTLSVERYNVAPLIRIDCISLSDIVDYYMENGSEMGCFSLFLKTVQYISTTLIYINNNSITFNIIQQ